MPTEAEMEQMRNQLAAKAELIQTRANELARIRQLHDTKEAEIQTIEAQLLDAVLKERDAVTNRLIHSNPDERRVAFIELKNDSPTYEAKLTEKLSLEYQRRTTDAALEKERRLYRPVELLMLFYANESAAPTTTTPTDPPPPTTTEPPPPTTTEPPPPTTTQTNFALASNGATATATSSYDADHTAENAINGAKHTNGNWSLPGGSWTSLGNPNTAPESLTIDFGTVRQISRVVIHMLAGNGSYSTEATEATMASQYANTNFTIEYYDGAKWTQIAAVVGNDKARRQFDFTAVSATKIRATITAAPTPNAYIVELEGLG